MSYGELYSVQYSLALYSCLAFTVRRTVYCFPLSLLEVVLLGPAEHGRGEELVEGSGPLHQAARQPLAPTVRRRTLTRR